MGYLELTILGSNSAISLVDRHPTSQFLTLANRHFLIDCGEGTQVQLRKNDIGFGRINHILISHLHGDHIFGLMPLLTSLHLLNRQKEIHIYALAELKKVIQTLLKACETSIKYPLSFHPLNSEKKEVIIEDDKVNVTSFPLMHGMPCCGFLFEEKPRSKYILKSTLKKDKIPISEIKKEQKHDWVNETGEIIPNVRLTAPAEEPLTYAFCTDTLPVDHLDNFFTNPKLLYHEATFKEEHAQIALKTNHSTAQQAAQMALKVKAENLVLGHFSTRYDGLDILLQEAREIFPNTHLAIEGKKYIIKHKERDLQII